MSTKIYDGLLATSRDPFVVRRRIKEVLEPLFYDKFNAAWTLALEGQKRGETWGQTFGWIPEAVGSASSLIPNTEYEVASQLYSMVEKLYSVPTHTFTFLDFGYEVCLLENGRGGLEPPLVLVFSEHGGRDYRKALIDAGVVVEYGYWNNSDEPDDVSPEEWSEREKAWSKLDVPRSDGLFMQMPSSFEAIYSKRMMQGN